MMKRRKSPPGTSTADALAVVPQFSGVTLDSLRVLAPHVDRLRVRPGAVLATEGQQARAFVAVLSGDVRVTRGGELVAIEGSGAQIGADSLLQRHPHGATWTAVSDVELLVVNGPAYRWARQELLSDVA